MSSATAPARARRTKRRDAGEIHERFETEPPELIEICMNCWRKDCISNACEEYRQARKELKERLGIKRL